jgi:hypothetical protein
MSSSALELAPAEAVPAVAVKTPFIVSPLYDGLFFFGSIGVVFLAWLADARFHVNGFYVLAVVAVASNGPHLASTWTRVYFDKREWQQRPVQIFVVPACIAAVVVGMTLWGWTGLRVLNSALLYWATYHFLAQDWGLLRIYQRRSG